MTDETLERMLDDVCARLVEHGDAVQVMMTWNEDGATKRLFRGAGNWYARQGMAHEFITADANQDAAEQIADRLNGDEGPSEEWRLFE